MDMLPAADADGRSGFDLFTMTENIGLDEYLVYMIAVGKRDGLACDIDGAFVVLCFIMFLAIAQNRNPLGFLPPGR